MQGSEETPLVMQITSPAFTDNSPIPQEYSCKGQDVSPPLTFTNIPNNAASLALIMHDPDAVGGDFVHWTMWDIPVSTSSLAANSVPLEVVQGLNSSGQNGYKGPCPPAGTGTHRYIFELYALDTTLSLPPETTRAELINTMQGHIIEQHALTGVYSGE